MKQKAEYFLNEEAVGWRQFTATGAHLMELSMRQGRRHGLMLEWHSSGHLAFATAYMDGKEHGIARQWAADGTLVGSHEMDHGTGLDLWWSMCQDGTWRLAEARTI